METARRLTLFHPKIKPGNNIVMYSTCRCRSYVLSPSSWHDSQFSRFLFEWSGHQVNLLERHVGWTESLDGRLAVVKTYFLNDLSDVLKVFLVYQLQQLNVAFPDKMAQVRVYGTHGQLSFCGDLSWRQPAFVEPEGDVFRFLFLLFGVFCAFDRLLAWGVSSSMAVKSASCLTLR